jgi:hypothetical protein
MAHQLVKKTTFFTPHKRMKAKTPFLEHTRMKAKKHPFWNAEKRQADRLMGSSIIAMIAGGVGEGELEPFLTTAKV